MLLFWTSYACSHGLWSIRHWFRPRGRPWLIVYTPIRWDRSLLWLTGELYCHSWHGRLVPYLASKTVAGVFKLALARFECSSGVVGATGECGLVTRGYSVVQGTDAVVLMSNNVASCGSRVLSSQAWAARRCLKVLNRQISNFHSAFTLVQSDWGQCRMLVHTELQNRQILEAVLAIGRSHLVHH